MKKNVDEIDGLLSSKSSIFFIKSTIIIQYGPQLSLPCLHYISLNCLLKNGNKIGSPQLIEMSYEIKRNSSDNACGYNSV